MKGDWVVPYKSLFRQNQITVTRLENETDVPLSG